MTLIELLVAIAIFFTVLVILISIFVISVKNQRRAFIVQNLQDNARFMIETISKEVRTSKINTNDTNGNLVDKLNIDNQNPNTVEFWFKNDDTLRRHEITDPGGPQPLHGSNVEVTGGFIVITKDSSNKDAQPRVVIIMKVFTQDTSQPVINVETTVTSRKYE